MVVHGASEGDTAPKSSPEDMSSPKTGVGSAESCDEEEEGSELGTGGRALTDDLIMAVWENGNIIAANRNSERAINFNFVYASHQRSHFFLMHLIPTFPAKPGG